MVFEKVSPKFTIKFNSQKLLNSITKTYHIILLCILQILPKSLKIVKCKTNQKSYKQIEIT